MQLLHTTMQQTVEDVLTSVFLERATMECFWEAGFGLSSCGEG